MKKHVCKFVKYSEEVESVNVGEEWKEMFGIDRITKEKVERLKIIFRCRCGKTQTFIDVPGGEFSKSLPDEFTVNPVLRLEGKKEEK